MFINLKRAKMKRRYNNNCHYAYSLCNAELVGLTHYEMWIKRVDYIEANLIVFIMIGCAESAYALIQWFG